MEETGLQGLCGCVDPALNIEIEIDVRLTGIPTTEGTISIIVSR